ncbi:MAG: NAD(P)-binding protein, partial [Lentisphaeria bacterium]|nr:NAD(P)-binding protein [Lentisphaeria bacterium]
MAKEVIIIGGGVGGMSAAHELLRRGFKVKVYEHKRIAGGKARSMPAPGTGIGDRKDLPGEHGFRFFPGFYEHLPATMAQIPLGNDRTVFDNLVDATRIRLARYDEKSILMTSRFPKSLDDLIVILEDLFDTSYGFEPGEVKFFAGKLWQLMTSCYIRRLYEYEKIAWSDYIEANGKSHAYRTLLESGLTRSLVAVQATVASTRTVGDILLQLLFDIATPGKSSDRLLNGPTNDVWIDPWLKWMRDTFTDNFEYYFDKEVDHIECNTQTRKIDHITVKNVIRDESGKITGYGDSFSVTGDYYISAVPVEVFARKITTEMKAVDPTLESIEILKDYVSWMNGIQFYLSENVTVDHGHCIYVDSEWALTSVSQIQFWKGFPIKDYGNGKVKGILSVDISDWFKKGLINQSFASNCSREEIKNEVWAQL